MEMAAVLIPVYKNELSRSEMISLRQCKRILNRYPVILVTSETLNIENSELSGWPVERYSNCYFDGIAGYNQLMLSKEFYQRFEAYSYILIYQLDAFVFFDRLQEFCELGYDYIGAPWLGGYRYIDGPERRYLYVGNGGFSLRRVSAFLDILDGEVSQGISDPEDVFWASRKELAIAPVETAISFAFEGLVRKSFELNHRKLPFGCHAWYNYDFEFFRPYIEGYGYHLEDITGNALDETLSKNIYRKGYFDIDRKTMLGALKVFADQTAPYKAVIFGAGKVGDECYKVLNFTGVEIMFVVDNDKEKQGKYLWKHKIISPEQFIAMGQTEGTVIIAAVGQKYCNEVMEQCNTLFRKGKQVLIAYEDLRAEIEKRLNAEKESYGGAK